MANNGTITGDEVLKGVVERVKQVDTEFKTLLATYSSLSQQLTQTSTVSGVEVIIGKANKANKEQITLLKEVANLKKAEANANKAVTLEKNASLNLDRKIATQQNKTNSYYKEQSSLLNRLRDSYKSLELKKQNGIALTKTEGLVYAKLATRVKALDASLKQADAAAGQFNRNVGNYRSGVQGLATSFRSLAGAFGFTSGIYIFAAALKDAFKRVRDFDKSMQNLAGILGETRKEIAPIEREVIRIAGASIKTSREVGALAEVLATLGKRGQDLINLIKPANDLSIALQATSDEAAEFLVQTLNAFQEPTTSAQEFANTITAIRTSTSLDFQKMRDSFQYITPISKILNKDLADTGAIVGLLADNGLKAESAGRLLGTALQKIAKEGKTLDSALEEINQATRDGVEGYDLLALASELFGKQAAKIGIILAANVDTLEKSANAIRGNATAIDDLVSQQLESLDAKIKILDSTWERLILTIENGEGSISQFFKGAISGVTGYLQELIDVEEAQSRVFNLTGADAQNSLTFFDRLKKMVEITSFSLIDLDTNYDNLVSSQREFNRYLAELDGNTGLSFLSDEINTLNKEIETNTDLTEDQIKLYKNQVAEIQAVYDANLQNREELEKQARQIVETTGKFEDFGAKIDILSNEQLQDFIAANKDVAKSLKNINDSFDDLDFTSLDSLNKKLQELTKTRNAFDLSDKEGFAKLTKEIKDTQKEIDAILGKGGSNSRKVIQGSIEAYQELIKELSELRDSTALTTEEYKKFDDQIAQTERKIKQLKEGIDSLQKVQGSQSGLLNLANPTIQRPDVAVIDEGALNALRDSQILAAEQVAQAEAAILRGRLTNYKGFTEQQTEALKEGLQLQLELKRNQEQAVQDLVLGSFDSVFQARVENINRELDANQNLLDTILSSNLASDEQKILAQQKADKEERRLLKEREKRERQAFLVRQGLALAEIAINLARTISAINLAAASIDAVTFGIGGIPYRAANIPLAIGTAAAQAGLVIAQSVPAFFKGKNPSDNYEGMATWGEKRKEVKIGSDGGIEVSPNKTTPLFVKKDDIITPNISTFNREISDPSSDIYQRVARRLSADTKDRQNMILVRQKTDTKGIETAIGKAMSKHKAPIYRPNIIIQQPRRNEY